MRYTLYASLLTAFIGACSAFETSLTPAAQCLDLIVTFSGDAGTLGPPFTFFLIPFKARPLVVEVPDSAFNATTNEGIVVIPKLPYKEGTQFIVTMDDGFGRGTGGVSRVHTVGGSSTTDCLSGGGNPPTAGLINIPSQPKQCSELDIGLASSLTSPVTIRGFIPSGTAFTLDGPKWTVNVAAGTQLVLYVEGAGKNDAQRETSDLLTVEAGSSQDCMGGTPPSTTAAQDPAAPEASQGTTAAGTTAAGTTSPSATATGSSTSATGTSIRTSLTVPAPSGRSTTVTESASAVNLPPSGSTPAVRSGMGLLAGLSAAVALLLVS